MMHYSSSLKNNPNAITVIEYKTIATINEIRLTMLNVKAMLIRIAITTTTSIGKAMIGGRMPKTRLYVITDAGIEIQRSAKKQLKSAKSRTMTDNPCSFEKMLLAK